MAYSVVPTVVTGDSWSAAQHNTYIRDNFTALWPYTTKGDIAYAATTTTLGRLPIGSEGEILSSISGALDWVAATAAEKYCFIRRTSNQSISNNTQTKITFESETFDNNSFWSAGAPTVINLPTAGYYRIMGNITLEQDGSGRRAAYVGATATLAAYAQAAGGSVTAISFNYIYKTIADNVDTYIWIWQDSGASLNIEKADISVTYMGA